MAASPLISLALLFSACFLAVAMCQQNESIVTTVNGQVQGLVIPGARVFLSIPYGASTAGRNRFMPPLPAAPWQGVLNCTTFGPACPQICDLPPLTCPVAGTSEDCLHLDVYTPRLADIQQKGPFPVMIFFPGGDFKQGGSSTLLYNGDFLANNTDAVVVVTNYRLGAFGFFMNQQAPGNLGVMDQTFALRWIQQNIKAFGGDPTDVTIFGQSAGGASVASQLVSPPATGLYNKAIMESNPIQLGLNTVEEAQNLSQAFAELLNCDYNDIACLQAANVSAILEAQNKAIDHDKSVPSHPLKGFMPWQPFVDGTIITGDPITAFPKGEYNKVPMMLGNVNDEGWIFIFAALPNPMTALEYRTLLDYIFKDQAKNVLSLYPAPTGGADARPMLATLGTDYIFACPMRNVSRYMSQWQPLYRYHFDHVFSFNPWGPDYQFCVDKVCHGSELPYVFNSAPLAGYQWDSEEVVLADFLSTNWGNFVTSKNPNVPFPTNGVQWPTFTAANDQVLHYQTPQSVIETGYRKTYCDFWDSIGYTWGA